MACGKVDRTKKKKKMEKSVSTGSDESLVNDEWNGLACSGRASRWKRRGRLRVTMVARVHLTPIFPTRGSAALSAHRRPHSLSRSRSRSRPRPRVAPPPLLSPVASLLDPPKIQRPFALTRERMVRSASGKPPLFPSSRSPPRRNCCSSSPLISKRFRVNPTPIHPFLRCTRYIHPLLRLVLPLSFLSFVLSDNLASYTHHPSLFFHLSERLLFRALTSIAIWFDEFLHPYTTRRQNDLRMEM